MFILDFEFLKNIKLQILVLQFIIVVSNKILDFKNRLIIDIQTSAKLRV